MTIIAVFGGIVPSQAVEANAPLPSFYPVSPAPAAYDPTKFLPRSEAAIAVAGANYREKDFVETISLNGTWKSFAIDRSATPFAADVDLDKGYEKVALDDSGWDSIPVPMDFFLKYKRNYREDKAKPYAKLWYRKTETIPASAAGKRVLLHFGVVGYEALLFVNGQKVGSHHGDFTPWEVDITKFVEPGKPAVLALRVFSDLGPNKYGGSELIKTTTHGYGSQYSQSNIKGGIWRSAEIRIEPALRVARMQISPDVESSSITVAGQIRFEGTTAKTVELYSSVIDADTKSSGASPAAPARLATVTVKPGDNAFEVKIPLKSPRLWSPETPNLYHLTLALVENGKAIAVKTERFGFRSFKIVGDRFFLNGKRIYLFGESIEVANTFERGKPEVDQPDATASAKKVAAEMLLAFRSRGSNALRLSEQPVPSAFLDLADEVGMMIYNMWAWSYGNKLSPEFEKNDFEEVTEWVQRDYNHPSVVMWLGGNEVHCDKDVAGVFDRQTKLIRSLERSGRPISAFSGAAYGYTGDIAIDTDFLDLHDYLGLGDKQWTYWDPHFDNVYKQALKVYSKDGGKTLPIPYVIWELVGYSWGQQSAPYEPGDVDTYLKWVKKPMAWGSPNGIGWAGSIGLAASLDKNRGARYGMETVGRRILDYVRQDLRVSGYAPWFCKYSIDLPSTSLWTQPVYCGLRDEIGLPLRNVFGGRSYKQTLFIVDSTNEAYDGAVARVTLAEADGSEKTLTEWSPATVQPWTKSTREVSFTIPATKTARWAQLRVRLWTRDGKELSRNFYDVFVENWGTVSAPVATKTTVGILSCDASETEKFKSILKTLQIQTVDISTPEALTSCRVLIVPPSSRSLAANLSETLPLVQAVKAWVRKGGTLLVMEQNWGGDLSICSRMVRSVSTVFADVVVPAHPALKGLSQANFEFWNNPAFGMTSRYALSPVGQDVIVARGPLLTESETCSVLTDGKSGQGRILSSQFDACALWGIDSAASLYLRNLLISAMGDAPATIRPWVESSRNVSLSKHAELMPIDLRPYANMAFKDDVAGDGKGGWTDQGDNDFRMVPLGRQIFRGVPFEIIDPANNGDKSCLALKDKPTGSFVNAVNGIKVGQKLSRLFFLHTQAMAKTSGDTLRYRVNYADGQKLDVATKERVSIADWWECGELPQAKLAFCAANASLHEVGLFLMEWSNPRPEVEIQSIDVVAPAGREMVSLVVAITGEKAGGAPVAINSAKWNCLAWQGGEIIRTGPLIPSASAPGEDGTVTISFPKRTVESATPVTFTRFFAQGKAKELTASARYLVCEIKGAAGSGEVEFALPDEAWNKAFRTKIAITQEPAFRTVRISLDEMPFKPGELRGEFYIYDADTHEFAFQIRNARLE